MKEKLNKKYLHAKNGPILKIQVAICIEIKIFREKSNFGYINKWKIILKRVWNYKKMQNLNIFDGKLMKNEMTIKNNN